MRVLAETVVIALDSTKSCGYYNGSRSSGGLVERDKCDVLKMALSALKHPFTQDSTHSCRNHSFFGNRHLDHCIFYIYQKG